MMWESASSLVCSNFDFPQFVNKGKMCVIQFMFYRLTIIWRMNAVEWCNISAHGLQTACVYIWDILRCVFVCLCVCVLGVFEGTGGSNTGRWPFPPLSSATVWVPDNILHTHTHTLLNGRAFDSHSSSMCTDLILYSALEYVRSRACGYLSLSKRHETVFILYLKVFRDFCHSIWLNPGAQTHSWFFWSFEIGFMVCLFFYFFVWLG